ncbi:uncharacterized protein LOC112015919 [Quercus suber]|uniref:DUF761 domain-containing protein n=1 Tax=Quercus suber TaxID=58331 RepID=A0AAW0LBY0_QUESU|nr:uncharacterized protein LOC112015919 [Quercus suber]POF20188.1 hypothetical protein CFP56_35975 [Quercus suber]
MEVHSPVIAKRLWNVLRVTFFMIRKGLISKRKLIMDMNLMMKRGKLLRKSLSNLMSHHHHSKNMARAGYGIQEYEFSCSNSPNPVFFHVPKRKHHYFPCINAPEVLEEVEEPLPQPQQEPKAVVLVPKTPEYTFNFRFDHASDFASGEKRSPLLSPFSVRVSNYSSEDENEGESEQVDHEAEEFIRRFYEQLRVQSHRQLLQYQDLQYEQMLARGTH